MATVNEQLVSALQYLADSVLTGRYGQDDSIDEESFRDDLEETLQDIETAFMRINGEK